MSFTFSRRNLLQMLSVGAGSLAFGVGPGGRARSALAGPATTPRRIVFFPIANGWPQVDVTQLGTENGAAQHTFFGNIGSSPTDYTLGQCLTPFDTLGLHNDLVLLDNLGYPRGTECADQAEHPFCTTQMLTGTKPQPAQLTELTAPATHESIDNYIADQIGSSLPWRSLYTTACSNTTISVLQDLTTQAPDRDPINLYSKVFGGLTNGAPSPALLSRLKRRQSVLDSVSSDLNAFIARLPAEDKTRAQAQLTAVRTMETQLTAQMNGSSCTPGAGPSALDYSQDINMPQSMRAFIDIVVAAFACDQTRVALMHTYLSDESTYNCGWAPANQPGLSYHALSHNVDGSNGTVFATVKQFHYQLVAELAAKLKAIPEGGGTMLDNTLIYCPTEIGFSNGNTHTNMGLLAVTVGGKNLGVKTGQYMQLGNPSAPGCWNAVPHQRLLVSFLNAMGLPDQTFGDDSTTGSGPLTGYLA